LFYRPFRVVPRRDPSGGGPWRPKPILGPGAELVTPSDVAPLGNRLSIDYCSSLSTVEETDVRLCRQIGPPQAVAYSSDGYFPGFRSAPRGMRSGAASPAATATCRLSGPAAASGSGSGCPRLTDRAVRRSDPIVELSTSDPTASIERSTGEVRERVSQETPLDLHRMCLAGGSFGCCGAP
jgi:hypothetical protein